MTDKHQYSEEEREAIYRVIGERRDMRHFVNDPVDEETMRRLIEVAHQAPSVGFIQPWRIIRIKNPELRTAIYQHVDAERIKTSEFLGDRQQEFLKLKLEGILDCGELLVMALMDKREDLIFGRRTMPEMDLASVSCAIQNMWLAARAEGLGMGWVSLFEPTEIAKLLNIPIGAQAVAILCLGHVKEFYPAPMLKLKGWREETDINDVVFKDSWDNKTQS
jgi:5,6-dimethylbenzimidazole synthase